MRGTSALSGKRSIIYIDGFNLYYGVLKGTRLKWLNVERLFEMIRKDDEIQAVKYFTALVEGRQQSLRQLTYLRALSACSRVQIVQGRFKYKNVRCLVKECQFEGRRFFRAQEEKRTDVNIAIHLLNDACEDQADRFVLVSGDSDLVPAISLVKRKFPEKLVCVYSPAREDSVRGYATEMRAAADRARNLPINLLKHSQFPHAIDDGSDEPITKPAGW